ncbi:hypothetical protein DKT69_30310 [Micromonospora sicca]|uniref:CARDB domain-containing protein n=1 Tax=Micromonospora sicca TaxID=2202420 RepID=A0A317DAU7_9ACTN|nr:hypothetical protein [Micromonospora sp. 4G51]PWR09765.1 hypothetical protein DKT69_30310 [Micromonospora sp. 4G51]
MSEFDEMLVSGEFAAYREAVVSAVHPAGPGAVRETVRRRRRRAVVATATAVVLAVAVPVAAHAALDRQHDPRPGPAQTAEPTPSATTASPTSPAPSPTPSTASPTPAAPDGRITRAQLLAARLDLPAWLPNPVCEAGPTRLSATYRTEGDVLLEGLDHGDVDGDGRDETLALLRCLVGQHGPSQVVAFDRDERGRIVTLGQVTRSARPNPEWLLAVEVTGGGTIRVEMADLAPGGGWSLDWSQRQWRGYRWTGERFTQVDGPTSFGPNPHLADLSVTATDLAWGPKNADGTRTGTITVTVRNLSQAPANLVEVHLRMQVGTTADGGDWSACQGGPPPKGPITCRFGPLGPGATRIFQFGLRNSNTSSGTGIAEVTPIGTDADPLLDPSRENNEDRYHYR